MRTQLAVALRMLAALTLLTGMLYPFAMTGLGRALFPHQAAGSLAYRGGHVVGSTLMAQSFTSRRYFHGRPAAVDQGGPLSGGSNLGPSSRALSAQVAGRVESVRASYGLPPSAKVPSDLVTTSASGFDPDITLAAASLQVPSVARARSLPVASVRAQLRVHTRRPLAAAGDEGIVNVLQLNLALDELQAH
jgi:potassium-transporting ATPase KdpC subunit